MMLQPFPPELQSHPHPQFVAASEKIFTIHHMSGGLSVFPLFEKECSVEYPGGKIIHPDTCI